MSTFESIIDTSVNTKIQKRSRYNRSASQFTSRQPAHVQHLDGLRAIAAIYVVLHHAVLQLPHSSGVVYNVCSKIFSKGHFAVDAFIVISGFCLMLPVAKNNQSAVQPLSFFKKRIRRILPTYYGAMAFSLLLIFTLIGTPSGTNWDVSIPVSHSDVFTHLTLIQDFFKDSNTKINHAFWSISVEFRIYLLFPILVFLFRKINPVGVTIGCIIASIAIWWVLSEVSSINTGLNGTNPHYLGLFTMGMLAAHIAYSSNAFFVSVKESDGLLIVPVVAGFTGLVLDATKLDYWVAADIAIGLACACLLVALKANKRTFLRNIFGWKPLAFTGTFAYSIYLVHAPLLEVFSRYFVMPLQLSPATATVSFLLLATPLVILLAYGFFLIAERPFIQKRNAAQPSAG